MTTDLIGLGDQADIILDIDTSTALTDALIHSVSEVCDHAEDATDSVVILRLADHSLPSTPDAAWPGDAEVHTVNKWERTLRRLERLPAPTIAVVEGAVGGPALELLLAVDYRIATPDVAIRPPLLGGVPWPGMLLHRLSQQVGVAASRRIALFGTEIAAERALHTGILDELAPAADLATPSPLPPSWPPGSRAANWRSGAASSWTRLPPASRSPSGPTLRPATAPCAAPAPRRRPTPPRPRGWRREHRPHQ
ncbi:hypothetical protein Srufu_020070 [Streptomyces libani subsp. rufus]|nr:hypothetical protein Srufu_020070 [Streptomyces libani subsp. rufus]